VVPFPLSLWISLRGWIDVHSGFRGTAPNFCGSVFSTCLCYHRSIGFFVFFWNSWRVLDAFPFHSGERFAVLAVPRTVACITSGFC